MNGPVDRLCKWASGQIANWPVNRLCEWANRQTANGPARVCIHQTGDLSDSCTVGLALICVLLDQWHDRLEQNKLTVRSTAGDFAVSSVGFLHLQPDAFVSDGKLTKRKTRQRNPPSLAEGPVCLGQVKRT